MYARKSSRLIYIHSGSNSQKKHIEKKLFFYFIFKFLVVKTAQKTRNKNSLFQ
jgi:hypothetical protein